MNNPAKDRGLITRVAGNIASGLVVLELTPGDTTDEALDRVATKAVNLAIRIVERTDARDLLCTTCQLASSKHPHSRCPRPG